MRMMTKLVGKQGMTVDLSQNPDFGFCFEWAGNSTLKCLSHFTTTGKCIFLKNLAPLFSTAVLNCFSATAKRKDANHSNSHFFKKASNQGGPLLDISVL